MIYRPPNFSSAGGIVTAGTQLTISRYTGTPPAGYTYASGGTIYYTTDGSDPRSPSAPAPETVLISGNSNACQWLVPSAGNGGFTLTAGAGPNQWTNSSDPVNIGNWTTAVTGVGYDTNPDYLPLIGANGNTQAQMSGVNATCYIRIPFTIADQAALDAMNSLKLSMKYDDGFRAYINGVFVAGRNDTDPSLTTDPSTAQANQIHDDPAAVVYEDIDITGAGMPALQVGANVLAIHGLNSPSTSSDLLFIARLTASAAGSGTTGGIAYSGPLTLNTSTTVKSRVFTNGVWSPITSANFIVDAVPASAANLAISEIHYHPTDPVLAEINAGYNSSSDFEFVELYNPTAQNVDLTNCKFTLGITYNFGDVDPTALTLAPGGRVILVNNQAAFLMRNGSSPTVRILGEFSGNLSNGGEQLILLAANDSVIADFTYGTTEPWPVAADGAGYSLVLNNPAGNAAYGDAGSWRSSADIGGAPGVANSVPFTGSPGGDSDNDGASDFAEYALGTNWNSAASTPQTPYTLLTDPAGAPPGSYLSFSFTRNLSADGFTISPQQSIDMLGWNAAGLVHLSTVNQGNGTAVVTLRSAQSLAAPPQRSYFRVRISPVP